MSRRQRRGRLAFFATLAGLIALGAAALTLNTHTTSHEGLLPPRQVQASAADAAGHSGERQHTYSEAEGVVAPPGMATLAGPAPSVIRRFARDWANRNTLLSAAAKREMVGLSAGAWAGAVFRQARLTLPAIEGVRAEGDFVMMRLTTVAPGSKTALVVTKERLLNPEGQPSAPRYEIYLARLDEVSPRGFAITAWEPQR